MKAVVTGGAGFIGSHMVDLLIECGFDVAVVDNLSTGRAENLAAHRGNRQVTLHEIDLLTMPPDAPCFEGAEYVFHFGGLGDIVPSIQQPRRYVDANVTGTVAVLEAARRAGARAVVYAASSSCYGSRPPVPTAEHAPIAPEYPYA